MCVIIMCVRFMFALIDVLSALNVINDVTFKSCLKNERFSKQKN